MRINWTKELSNEVVKSVYIQLVEGKTTRRSIESTLKNTPHAGPFRSLVVNGGIDRARTIARKALHRRGLIEV